MSLTFSKNVNRRSVRQQPRPPFELPGRTLHKHSHHSIPARRNIYRLLIKCHGVPRFHILILLQDSCNIMCLSFTWVICCWFNALYCEFYVLRASVIMKRSNILCKTSVLIILAQHKPNCKQNKIIVKPYSFNNAEKWINRTTQKPAFCNHTHSKKEKQH